MTDKRTVTDATPEFNLRTIGPEPSGATPLEDEDLLGLIPDFVSTRGDLNLVEFENIARALPWAYKQALQNEPRAILDFRFMLALHKRMFSEVWRWAGTLRQRDTNIGVDPSQITQDSRAALDDAIFWQENDVFSVDERAARIHGRLVSIHPFPNGNGRCTRLIADLYLVSVNEPIFSWGGTRLDVDGSTRVRYIGDLVRAITTDDYDDLIGFARS